MRWEEEANGTARGGRKAWGWGRGRGQSLRKEVEEVRWTVVHGQSPTGEDGGTVKWSANITPDRKRSALAFLILSIEADIVFSLHCNAKLK